MMHLLIILIRKFYRKTKGEKSDPGGSKDPIGYIRIHRIHENPQNQAESMRIHQNPPESTRIHQDP
jgi:hypothetical protein